jgi:hypothetical protein
MLADLVPHVGEIVIGCLAVAGGVLLGGLLSGGSLRVGARLLHRKQVPPWAVKTFRLLGGAAGGLAVYFLVFGTGGGGFGFGGGSGWFGSGGKGTDGGPTPAPSAHSTSTTQPMGEILRIEMLGGARYKGEVRPNLDKDRDRFYLVDGIKEPQTWDEVRRLIESNKQYKVMEIVILQKGSVAEGHEAVRELKQLASTYSLTVHVIKPPAGEG